MADPATYRPAPGTIPVEPGVYTFKDADGRVIYVGKAKNLRARLSNYFQDVSQLHPRTRTMVTTANRVDWTVVSSEVEALQLEYTWIKRFDPRFNVKYRDDKSYPMLAVSTGNEYPRAFVYRGPRRKGVRYFGPYSHAWAIRETLDLLTRVFPIRTCSQGVFNRHSKLGRPCLLGYIEKCCAPCVGNVTAEEHKELVAAFCSFMAGHTDPVTKKLTAEMHKAAEQLDFERAARLRDDLEAITKVMERQAVVLGDGTDADIIATASDELETALHIFHIRGGRIRGQRGWVVENNGSISQVLQEFLVQFYGDAAEHAEAANAAQTGAGWDADAQTAGQSPIPREVLVQVMPDDAANSETWLSQLRGSKVELRVPQRGDKRVLMETVERNAQEALKQHKLKRVGDLTARSAALQELQQALFLDEPVLRIECTDVSHIQGTDVVASLVVFEDGLPKKADYRRYKIQEAAGDGHSNDVASIAEIVRRRFQRYHEDKRIVPSTTEFSDEPVQKRFAYPPQVFIVDGGLPQVNAAQEVFEELGINDIALIGLAKRLEEVWLPGEEDPLILPRTSQALFLLQQIRDEAHRFAISFHRQQRSQRMRSSVLDSIQGLGAVRRQELVKHFGSVAKISEATVEEIAAVKGFGPKLAQSVYTALHSKT
ncbi:excinuclease ABC subunit UvrC [Corynebacterium freiburgense]|uniref:excinuclease ABC subunit UvrC n=1 Tax=Corynebacterium freiburgense TaxID=556548 RepID=UPI00041BC5A7|nr:excinuclease ABC subunit UvrC [Corynebacterium freiburgense]WJZ02752.1 UvrABC system protein C [Corynebacterium freiburgense]